MSLWESARWAMNLLSVRPTRLSIHARIWCMRQLVVSTTQMVVYQFELCGPSGCGRTCFVSGRTCYVTGHDFSRAANAAISTRALAPEGIWVKTSGVSGQGNSGCYFRRTTLAGRLRDNFNCIQKRVVGHRGEVKFDLALGSCLYVVKCLYHRAPSVLP